MTFPRIKDPRTECPRNQAILEERLEARGKLKRKHNNGPLVGDYIHMKDGRLCRFSHNHGEHGLQTTDGRHGASFYLTQNGHLSFSGGLDPVVPLENIQPRCEVIDAPVWFFDKGIGGPGRGVTFQVTFPVWEEV